MKSLIRAVISRQAVGKYSLLQVRVTGVAGARNCTGLLAKMFEWRSKSRTGRDSRAFPRFPPHQRSTSTVEKAFEKRKGGRQPPGTFLCTLARFFLFFLFFLSFFSSFFRLQFNPFFFELQTFIIFSFKILLIRLCGSRFFFNKFDHFEFVKIDIYR